jgi:hypothetical protein
MMLIGLFILAFLAICGVLSLFEPGEDDDDDDFDGDMLTFI